MSRKEVRPDERLVAAASGRDGRPFDNKPEAFLKKDFAKGSATRGEQRQPVDASPTFLLGHTTYHGRTASPSTSRSPSPQNCGDAVLCGRPEGTCGAGHHDDNLASLPIFPSLQGTATVVDLAFAVETSSQQDIAMEAMRLSKQTLSRGDSGVDIEQSKFLQSSRTVPHRFWLGVLCYIRGAHEPPHPLHRPGQPTALHGPAHETRPLRHVPAPQ
jgi:hypothetical protein